MSIWGFSEVHNRPKSQPALRNKGVSLRGYKAPPYSADLDYSIGSTSLNTNPDMDVEELGNRVTKAAHDLRGKYGLIIKEPLY